MHISGNQEKNIIELINIRKSMHGKLVMSYHRAVHGFFMYLYFRVKNVASDGYFYTVTLI